MQMKRISDGVVGEVIAVAALLAAIEAPEPFAALEAAGAIARETDTVRITRGDVVESAGLGDSIGVFGDEPFALSERALIRGFDPA